MNTYPTPGPGALCYILLGWNPLSSLIKEARVPIGGRTEAQGYGGEIGRTSYDKGFQTFLPNNENS